MPSVRFGFDARAAFLDPHRGFGRVTRCLADALLDEAPGEIVVFVPHGAVVPARWYPRAAAIVHLSRPRRAAFLTDGPAWAWTLRRHGVHALHLPAWGVPPGVGVPVVATFHDATPFRFPAPPSAWARHRLRSAARSLRRAELVHAVSAHARAELLATTTVRPERILVRHWGVGLPFSPAPSPATPKHVLFVGGVEVHKNLAVVLRAFADPAAAALPPLLVTGAAGPVRELAGRVVPGLPPERLSSVATPDDEALVELYRHALALVVPSKNEGFGLPTLEAMACGSPVLAARAGALPEVCGEAAELLDPDDPVAWRNALLALAAGPERRARRIAAGLERAATLTWPRTARGLLELYRAAARRPSARI